MDNIIYVSTPYFEKNFRTLMKQRFKDEVGVLSDTEDSTLKLLAKLLPSINRI